MRRALPALLFLALPLAGCLGIGETVSSFDFEVSIAGTGTWYRSSTNITFHAAPINIDKQQPGPMGGGGTVRRLESPLGNVTLLVRLADAAKHKSSLEFHVMLSIPGGHVSGERRGNLSQPLEFNATGPGRYAFVAFLGTGILRDASPRTLNLDLESAWRIRSQIHPVWLQGQPTPTNYPTMADSFEFAVGNGVSYIDARTRYVGDWPAATGTDVDLELQLPSEQPVSCQGKGGGTNPQPHPNQASERALVPSYGFPGIWTARVGGLSQRCWGTSQPYYVNAANVPYELLLSVRGSEPVKT